MISLILYNIIRLMNVYTDNKLVVLCYKVNNLECISDEIKPEIIHIGG